MTITELREIRPNIFLAGFSDGSEIKLSLNTIADCSLFLGKEITEEDFSELFAAAQLSSCKERSLRIIGARPMSCKELFDRLVEKGEDPVNAEVCVEWLIGLHYLDDLKYAEMLVRHYSSKGYGLAKIKNELYRRGIAKSLWDEALHEMPENDDTIYKLLCRKLKSDHPDRQELKKATDSLFRRGYSWDKIKAAVSRFETENGSD